jgi:hypothetical protein
LICRLCNQPRKLIRAHVIPEAFFRPLRADGQAPILITGTPGHHPARAPIGVYDQTILCKACERSFDVPDSYGTSLFLHEFEQLFTAVERDGRAIGYTSPHVNQALLLRFLVLVLWRASVSTHRFYHRVSLGPYESDAHQFVLDSGAPPPELFGAVLSRWTPQPGGAYAKGALMDPFRERWGGVIAYRFYFGEIVAYIRVGPRPFPKPLSQYTLCSGPETVVIARDITKSNDFDAMRLTAIRSHANASESKSMNNAQRRSGRAA